MKLTGVQGNVLAMRTRTAFRMSLRASGQGCASLASLWMSLRASAWGPRKGAPFAGKGATRERCPAPASGRSRAWRTLGRRGAAIRVPWQKRSTLLPPPGAHTPTKSVIANQCAHWCGNPRPRRDTYQTRRTLGKFAVAAYSPGIVAFRFVLPQEMRIATSLRSSQ